ncbi:amino acid adenylation domain-containing protein [Streptomyces sp. NPDC059698]|uniref:amino acid adenylation domain-containing protein n=1 Tax=unclassified Streptomyces TaxID=2593676 RepID=UPI00093BAF6D|nr:amino acid adenylation domain-containing protein [Streptomyces sp. CB02366]OKJ28036.1 amino acid adenyltransferase [Streptomyces sp. CB02366]TVP35690.1 amino acid adenyltransferase [Streptomyces griseus subsp. griseus]WSS58881.1 amino acid adenylation domain-containing protein [Streptomyces sp. NBC_01178]
MRNLISYLAEAAESRPDSVAAEMQGETLTYAQLHIRSSALAATLIREGVHPGEHVGLWLKKSLEAVVGIYGILKTGAAYVPIDPATPLDRVMKIISKCELSGVITHAEQADWLLGLPAAVRPKGPVVHVGAARGETDDSPVIPWHIAVGATGPGSATATPELPDLCPDSPAYLFHTSGSKGTPKGVVLSHANAMAFVEWAVDEFDLTSRDRVSSHAPLHFDLSVLDIFATCRAGARVVLLPASQIGFGGILNRVVVEHGITVWYSVPNALGRMVSADNSELLRSSSLRCVLFAGENFPLGPLRRLRELLPGAALYNLFGPTETNVCTFHQVRDQDLEQGRTEPVPIGRPCPYATAFVVDPAGIPLDQVPGTVGELCVSGASVMLGYWKDAQLTAEKTLRLTHEDGTPVDAYRTGDTVRVSPGSLYSFLGRNDDMVKVRGYRVELGDVESALSEVPSVREAVCVVVGGTEGEKRLEAYVVSRSPEPTALELRRHCLATLPRHMVPERFHFLTALPRTRSGKVDRLSMTAAE